MSTLRTYNLQSIDSGSVNIQLSPNAGAILAGLTTAQSGLHVTSGSVGIGTDNPQAELQINSDVFSNIKITSARTGATQQIGGVGFNTFTSDGTLTQASTINALVDGTLLIKNASSTERLRLNSSGNIGINTSDNINGKLTIQADDDDELLFQVRANNGRAAQLKSTASASNTDPFVFQTNNSWGFDVDTLRVLTLASDYNVGIGTDNPATNFKLDVNGDLSLGELGGSDNTYIDQKQNGQLNIINSGRQADSGGVRINKTNSISGDTTYFRDFEVYDGKDELLFLIDGSTGNIGIGTDNPATKLDVQDGDITIRNGSEHNAIRTTPDGKLQFLRNAAANNTVSVTIDDGNGNVGIGSTIPTQALDVDGRITKTEYEPGEIIERICSVCDGSTHAVKSGSYTITNVTSEQAGTTSDAVCSGSSIDYKCPAGAKRIHYEYWFKWEATERSGISHFFIEVDGADVVPSQRTFASNFSRYSTTYYHHGEGWYCMSWVFECDASSTDTDEGQYADWADNEQTKTIRTKFREYNGSYEVVLHTNYYWDGSTASGTNHDPIKPMLIITTTA